MTKKRELQQIGINHLSDNDFMNLVKNVLQNHILFWAPTFRRKGVL